MVDCEYGGPGERGVNPSHVCFADSREGKNMEIAFLLDRREAAANEALHSNELLALAEARIRKRGCELRGCGSIASLHKFILRLPLCKCSLPTLEKESDCRMRARQSNKEAAHGPRGRLPLPIAGPTAGNYVERQCSGFLPPRRR